MTDEHVGDLCRWIVIGAAALVATEVLVLSGHRLMPITVVRIGSGTAVQPLIVDGRALSEGFEAVFAPRAAPVGAIPPTPPRDAGSVFA